MTRVMEAQCASSGGRDALDGVLAAHRGLGNDELTQSLVVLASEKARGRNEADDAAHPCLSNREVQEKRILVRMPEETSRVDASALGGEFSSPVRRIPDHDIE